MIISNTRVTYTISNEGASMKLNGEAQFDSNGIITSFSGQFYNPSTVEDQEFGDFIGDFWYTENEDKTVSKSMNAVPQEKMATACDFLETTIQELHEYYNTVNAEPEPEAEAEKA